ncbi:ankyrin repeat domain-containing protein [bacterium]|nr:ankyrin repeat domain-containing protein [bacterium]
MTGPNFAAPTNENPEVVTLLIKAGADVNAKSESGRTPLDFAISPPYGSPKPKNAEVLRAAGGKRGQDLP